MVFFVIIIGAGIWFQEDVLKLLPKFDTPTLTIPDEARSEQVAKPEEKASIPIEEPEVQEQYYSPIERKIQLEILNGCGQKGVAKKLTQRLKKSNYDVVNSGNYMENGKLNFDVKESKIIDQVNNPDKTQELADLMGITNIEVYEHPSPIADITIIIGKDYSSLKIFQ